MVNASIFDQGRQKKTLHSYVWQISLLAFLYSVVCTPLEIWINSDITVIQTVIPLLWDTVMSVMHYLFYWLSFAYLLWAVGRFTLRQSKGILATYAIVASARYVISMLAGYVVNGFPTATEFFEEVLLYLLLDIFLDLLFMGLAVWIAYEILDKPWKGMTPPASLEKLPVCRWMPFASMFSFSNGMQRANLLMAAIPAVTQIVYRAIYDIAFYGVARDLADLLWMISYYLADVLSIFIGYFVILLLLNRFYLNEEKARLEYRQIED